VSRYTTIVRPNRRTVQPAPSRSQECVECRAAGLMAKCLRTLRVRPAKSEIGKVVRRRGART